MKFVHLDDLTPPLWFHAWQTMFDPALGDHMGVDAALIAAKPSLEQFYENIMRAHEAGRFEAWAITKGGSFKGYVLLDRQVGEWEISTVLTDPADWGSGLGARATIHACKYAFEQLGAEWVVAFTQGKDPKVPELLHRGGFKPLMNFHVLARETWEARWRARRDR